MLDKLNSIYILSFFINDASIGIYNTHVHVRFIYDALFLITFLMSFCCIYIFFHKGNKDALFKQYFVFMEFLTNFPITLGVIGTLYSMSIAVSALNSNDKISETISLNFGAAVTTTIIGGLVYGYCFFLQAILSKYIGHLEYEKSQAPSSDINHR